MESLIGPIKWLNSNLPFNLRETEDYFGEMEKVFKCPDCGRELGRKFGLRKKHD
jgi:hypothetical protein